MQEEGKGQESQPANQVDASLLSDEKYWLYSVRNQSTKPLNVILELDGVGMSMEVDTGAFASIVSKDYYLKTCEKTASRYVLQEPSWLPIWVTPSVSIRHRTIATQPSLLVDAEARLKDFHGLLSLQSVLDTYQKEFAERLGTVKDVKAAIHAEANPHHCCLITAILTQEESRAGAG